MPNWTKEQRLAIDLDNRNILVSAGAGSGKTAVLTERVINKIRKGVKINQLLILTFTRAAAMEMKERIRKALTEEGLQEALLLLDSSYITTFDSFALTIVKRYHYCLGIGKNIEITPQSIVDVQKNRIINEIIDEYYLNDDQEFKKIIKDFCLKNDDDFRKAVNNIYKRLEQVLNKEEYLNNYFKDYHKVVREQINVYENIWKEKIDSLKAMINKLCDYCDGTIYDGVKRVVASFNDEINIYNLKDNLSLSLPNYNSKTCDVEYQNLKKKVKELTDKYTKSLIYNSESDLINEVEKTIPYQKKIIEVILKVDERLTKYKRDNSLFTFSDIAKKAYEIAKNEEVRKELQNEFNEIMIDEYQDTSDIQEAFISLISNNNVYMVGDMKQSIYGFRNANPELFKSKFNYFDNPSVDSNNIRIDLLHNFRSRKEVVDTINGMFATLMQKDFGGIEYQDGHIMNQGNHAYDQQPKNISEYPKMFDLEVFDYGDVNLRNSNSEIEAFIIAKDILKKIHNQYKVFDKELIDSDNGPYREAVYSDFAILMDRTRDFDLYKRIFEYFNIPLQIYCEESLLKGYNFIIISNILKFIYLIEQKDFSKDFKHLFVSIARSYLFAMNDDKIFDIINNNKIFENEIFKKAQKISKDISFLPFKDLLALIVDEFEFYNKIHLVGNIDKFIAEIDYIYNLADVYNQCENKLSEFISFIDDIIQYEMKLDYNFTVGNQNGVKLMTVHKSKGLEFPVIYCSGMDNQFNEDDLKKAYLFNQKVGIVCPYFEYGKKNTFLKDNFAYLSLNDDIAEKIRLFYVMLTRAKEKIIFVTSSLKLQNEFLPSTYRKQHIISFKDIFTYAINNVSYEHFILSEDDINFTEDYKSVKNLNFENLKNGINKINVKELNIQSEKIIKQRFSKNLISLDDDSIKKIKKQGTDVHYLLENISFEKALTNTSYLEKLHTNNEYKKLLINFFNNDLFKNLNNPKFYKEFEFSYIEDNIKFTGIIDLLIKCDDQVLIIDYKLKRIDDLEYLRQLQGYSNYISKITDKNVYCYLYSIVDGIMKKI